MLVNLNAHIQAAYNSSLISKAWLVLLDLDHELVDVDQLCDCRDLRKWRHPQHSAESALTC